MPDFQTISGHQAWSDVGGQSTSLRVAELKQRPEAEIRSNLGMLEIRTGANVTRARGPWTDFKRTLTTIFGGLPKLLGGISPGEANEQKLRHAEYKFDRCVNKLVEALCNDPTTSPNEIQQKLSEITQQSIIMRNLDPSLKQDANAQLRNRLEANLRESFVAIGQRDPRLMVATLQKLSAATNQDGLKFPYLQTLKGVIPPAIENGKPGEEFSDAEVRRLFEWQCVNQALATGSAYRGQMSIDLTNSVDLQQRFTSRQDAGVREVSGLQVTKLFCKDLARIKFFLPESDSEARSLRNSGSWKAPENAVKHLNDLVLKLDPHISEADRKTAVLNLSILFSQDTLNSIHFGVELSQIQPDSGISLVTRVVDAETEIRAEIEEEIPGKDGLGSPKKSLMIYASSHKTITGFNADSCNDAIPQTQQKINLLDEHVVLKIDLDHLKKSPLDAEVVRANVQLDLDFHSTERLDFI